MSSEWQLTTLGAVTTWMSGGTPTKDDAKYWGGDIPWISANSMHSTRYSKSELRLTAEGLACGSRMAPKDTVLLLVRGGALHNRIPVGIAERDVAFNQDVKAIVAKPELLRPWYLLYWLLGHESFLLGAVVEFTGIGAGKLDTKRMQGLEMRLPSLTEQDQILKVIKPIDDRITLLRETNTTLEAIAQALFKSWFVDFDPVRAKLARRSREGGNPEAGGAYDALDPRLRGNDGTGMDEATAALFPDGFEESALGLVPRGWRLLPFGQLLSQTIGGDWGSDEPTESNNTKVAIIRGTDIPDLQSGANSRVPVRYTSPKKLATRKLEDGDIVLEVSGGSKDQPTGRALYLTNGILNQFDCPVEPASFCRLLRPNTKELGVLLGQHLTYIYSQGKTWEYQNQSTGIANFQTTHFLATELVAVPGDEVLVAFAAFVRPMIDRMHLTHVQTLATLRDTLLPRLISGQLRLPEPCRSG